MKKGKMVLQLFFTMLKIGLFTFGGGYAMIALLENEFVEKKTWLDKDEFLNIAAIAESTPGPIAINSATYIGYKNAGVLGSIFATLGVCIPSFAIIYVIAIFLNRFLEFEIIASAFKGIQVGVIFIIFMAGLKMLKNIKKTAFNITVITLTVVISVIFSVMMVNFSAIFYILFSGFLGLVIYLVNYFKSKGDKRK